MKKFFLCVVLILLASASETALAQNGGGGGRQQAMQSYLKDSLNLSSAMIDSVTSINREYQPQMRTIFTDQSASADDKQTKMAALRTAMEARYKSAGLTDDQIQKMRDHQNRMMAQMRNRMNNGNQ